jgi:hypothetical protein
MGWRGMRRLGTIGVLASLTLAVSVAGSLQGAAAAGTAAPGVHGPKQFKNLVPHGAVPSTRAAERLKLHSRKANGPVALAPKVYLVFWGNQWNTQGQDAATALQALFSGLGGADDTWSTVLTQYCSKLPKKIVLPTPSCTTWSTPTAPAAADGAALAAEAQNAALHFKNTKVKRNRNAIYVLASPPGTTPDGFPQFCGYHTWNAVNKLGNLVYVNLPYIPDLAPDACTQQANPGPLDGYTVTASHEYAETVTDFVYDSPAVGDGGWWSGTGAEGDPIQEIGDLCSDAVNDDLDGPITLDTGTFVVEGLFSNATGGCVLSG